MYRYIISAKPTAFVDDDAVEAQSNPLGSTEIDDPNQPPPKKARISGAQKKKIAREEGRKQKGANKGRKFTKIREEVDVCWKFANGEQCPHGSKFVFARLNYGATTYHRFTHFHLS